MTHDAHRSDAAAPSPDHQVAHQHPDSRKGTSPILKWIVAGGLFLGAGVVLWQLGISLVWLFLAACVVLHPLMHAGHGGHGGSK